VKRQIGQIEKMMSSNESASAGDSDGQEPDEALTALSALPSPEHRASDPGRPNTIGTEWFRDPERERVFEQRSHCRGFAWRSHFQGDCLLCC
jgi:hypothetical protein